MITAMANHTVQCHMHYPRTVRDLNPKHTPSAGLSHNTSFKVRRHRFHTFVFRIGCGSWA